MLKEEYRSTLDELETIAKNNEDSWQKIQDSEDTSDFVGFIEQKKLAQYHPEDGQPLARFALGKASMYDTFKVLEKLGIDRENFYNLNSVGLRCDEFVTKHDGMHVLFAGCSITAGEGIPLEYTWPNLVHQHISKQTKTSGYFNVAKPGASIIDIITQMKQYMNLYGKPEVIFFNFPDFERENKVAYTERGRETGEVEKEIITLQLIYGVYELFSKYCDANGIKLFSFTWDHPETTIWDYPFNPVEHFSNLYMYSDDRREEYFFDYKNVEMPYPDYRYTAFDGAHPGFAAHSFYADFISEHYDAWRSNDKKD